jgi:hypothetical protein
MFLSHKTVGILSFKLSLTNPAMAIDLSSPLENPLSPKVIFHTHVSGYIKSLNWL